MMFYKNKGLNKYDWQEILYQRVMQYFWKMLFPIFQFPDKIWQIAYVLWYSELLIGIFYFKPMTLSKIQKEGPF